MKSQALQMDNIALALGPYAAPPLLCPRGKASLTAAISSGPIRQQPPTTSAP